MHFQQNILSSKLAISSNGEALASEKIPRNAGSAVEVLATSFLSSHNVSDPAKLLFGFPVA